MFLLFNINFLFLPIKQFLFFIFILLYFFFYKTTSIFILFLFLSTAFPPSIFSLPIKLEGLLEAQIFKALEDLVNILLLNI